MKELNNELKEKIVNIVKEKMPELSETEINEKLNCSSTKEISNLELENITGGITNEYFDFDENRELYGWKFKDLYDHLLSVYEALGSTVDARDIVLEMAEMYIPAPQWDWYIDCPAPGFIYRAMYEIYFHNTDYPSIW